MSKSYATLNFCKCFWCIRNFFDNFYIAASEQFCNIICNYWFYSGNGCQTEIILKRIFTKIHLNNFTHAFVSISTWNIFLITKHLVLPLKQKYIFTNKVCLKILHSLMIFTKHQTLLKISAQSENLDLPDYFFTIMS